MQSEFDKYINNEMSDKERNLFEQQLNEDAPLAVQLEEYRNMLNALKTQMLREKIAATIASNRGANPPGKKNIPKWFWGLSAVLLISVAMIWYLKPVENGAIKTPPTELQYEIQEPSDIDPTVPVEESKENKIAASKKPNTTEQIAQNSMPEPTDAFSGVRGLETGTSEWKTFVESVWVTRFEVRPEEFNPRFAPIVDLLKEKNYTDAFVQLYSIEQVTPQNDTLTYLKAYCLLEMKEGAEALSYFEKLPPNNEWKAKAQWYSVLAHLLNGEKQSAIDKAAIITKDLNHPFYSEAKALSK